MTAMKPRTNFQVGGALIALYISAHSLLAQTDDARFLVQQAGKSGFINKSGILVIPARFHAATEFNNGVAIVMPAPQKGEIIDVTGQTVGSLALFKSIQPFSDGMAAVLQDESHHGFVDATGKLVIPTKFSAAANFSEGLAAVADPTGKWGWIDKSGKYVIAPQFDGGGEFHEGMCRFSRKDQAGFFKAGYLDKAGTVMVQAAYILASDYSDGLALVWDGKIRRFLDKTGKVAIELPPGSSARDFRDGLAPAKIGNVAGFIDKSGKLVIKSNYDLTLPFSEGLAPVRIGGKEIGKWGCINPEGKLVIPAQFPEGPVFRNGLARIKTIDGIGYIDKSGSWVWKPTK
jgi:hypothetical protein